MSKKIRIVTHSGGFHADDVFGVATLMLLLGAENVEIVRTRDPEIIKTGDYVLDVGNMYDPEHNRFDHHQSGGAGKRTNGIPYASFGLIWKHFGEKLAGSAEAAEDIDVRLVQSIDAFDSAIDTCAPLIKDVFPYVISKATFAFASVEHDELNAAFFEAVRWATMLLEREIVFTKRRMIVFQIAHDVYAASQRKEIILFEKDGLEREIIMEAFQKYPDVIYFVRKHADGTWQAACAVDDVHEYKNRKSFPAAWAGKRDAELAQITGVKDAIVCHNGRFMCITKTEEGALKLARLALDN